MLWRYCCPYPRSRDSQTAFPVPDPSSTRTSDHTSFEYLKYHYKNKYNIDQIKEVSKYDNFELDEKLMFMDHDFTAVEEDDRFEVFGNLPVDRTDTR